MVKSFTWFGNKLFRVFLYKRISATTKAKAIWAERNFLGWEKGELLHTKYGWSLEYHSTGQGPGSIHKHISLNSVELPTETLPKLKEISCQNLMKQIFEWEWQ